MIIGTVAIIALERISNFLTTSILPHAGSSIEYSSLGTTIEGPLRTYLEQHSAGLPFSPPELIKAWGAIGIIFIIISRRGNLGARIGWILFGLFTCAGVYAGTHLPSQWTATSITAFTWCIVSIYALPFTRRQQAYRRINRGIFQGARRRVEMLKKRALQSARERGYPNLDEYFAERGNQPSEVIAKELTIPKSGARVLSGEFLEAEISTRSVLNPRQQREIALDIRSGEYSNSQIAQRHGCSPAVVKRVKERTEATIRGTTEGKSFSSTSPSSSRASRRRRSGETAKHSAADHTAAPPAGFESALTAPDADLARETRTYENTP
jgi:hypothetical protein